MSDSHIEFENHRPWCRVKTHARDCTCDAGSRSMPTDTPPGGPLITMPPARDVRRELRVQHERVAALEAELARMREERDKAAQGRSCEDGQRQAWDKAIEIVNALHAPSSMVYVQHAILDRLEAARAAALTGRGEDSQ